MCMLRHQFHIVLVLHFDFGQGLKDLRIIFMVGKDVISDIRIHGHANVTFDLKISILPMQITSYVSIAPSWILVSKLITHVLIGDKKNKIEHLLTIELT